MTRPPTKKQLDMLRVIRDAPGCSISGLIHETRFRGTPTLADYSFVRRLEKKGMIRKEPRKGNAKRLYLTELGEAYAA